MIVLCAYILCFQSVKTFALCEEILGNIRTVRSFGNEHLECERLANEVKESAKLNIMLGHGIGFFQVFLISYLL